MHSAIAFLTDLALVLGVAALTTVASQRLRLPPVFGYLVAGVVIGPTDYFPLVAGSGTVRTLSELGVILLMFSLGLGFTIQQMDGRRGSGSTPAQPARINAGSGTSARRHQACFIPPAGTSTPFPPPRHPPRAPIVVRRM